MRYFLLIFGLCVVAVMAVFGKRGDMSADHRFKCSRIWSANPSFVRKRRRKIFLDQQHELAPAGRWHDRAGSLV